MRLAVPNEIEVTLDWKILSVCDAECIIDKLIAMKRMGTHIVLAMGYPPTLKNLALQVTSQCTHHLDSVATSY